MASPAIISNTTFTLADRLKIQQERARNAEYRVMGRLTSVVFEGKRSNAGASQSRPRYANPQQAHLVSDSLKPFSEWQAKTWASLTLDWLGYKNAPPIAVSVDRHDLLLPMGLTPLPDIPNPLWIPKNAGDVAPRIKQLLVGCPVVGDRACGRLKARDGHQYLIFQPVLELSVFVGVGGGGFGKIRCGTCPVDHTHMALLIDPRAMQGFFVGGSFHAGF